MSKYLRPLAVPSRACTLAALAAASAAVLVGACSSTPSRFQQSRPSYGLTGGAENLQSSAPSGVHSDAPVESNGAQRRDDPHANAVYRGGRDPLTGKAQPPTWGSPPTVGQPGQAQQAGVAAPRTGQRSQVAGRTVIEVGEGDTLYGLSTKYRVSMNSIMLANGLNDPSLAPGQRLVIPTR